MRKDMTRLIGATLALMVIGAMMPMSTATERYINAARDAGCPRDQLVNFMRANVALQPRQLAASAAARLCDREGGPTKIGYGGARGGGKSHWGLAQIFCDDCARYPGLKFLYLRKVGKAGKEAILDLRREVLHSTPHEYLEQKGVLIRKDNGSKVILGHFQHDRDIDNYLGLQYDGALIEEATQLTYRKVQDVGTCVRSAKPGWRPRQYFTTNPGNIGHAWFKALFIEPMRRGAEADTRFIQATARDNAFLNAEYRKELEGLLGWQRKAWFEGDWDIAAGQFFTTFRHGTHVIPHPEIPESWRVWCSLDYGFTHYTAAYLLAQDGDGNVYLVDEHAERQWLVERHAKAIRAMLDRNAIAEHRIEAFRAGADVFAKKINGGTVADDYKAHGFKLKAANDDRINGAAEILRRLGDAQADPPIAPRLFIGERCRRLIDCMPSLQHDPNRPEDVLKVDTDENGLGGDDPYDAARYGVMHAANRRKWEVS
jgi:phage terminase large subunit